MADRDRFVESVMLWGMGMALSEEEDDALADVVQPCYAALALANDYFSFEREWDEACHGGPKPMNAVWLHMHWHGINALAAKAMVKDAANRYESTFLDRSDEFRRNSPIASNKLDRYLSGLAYQVSGNVVWSLNCPRYHPQFRHDSDVTVENALTTVPGGGGNGDRSEPSEP